MIILIIQYLFHRLINSKGLNYLQILIGFPLIALTKNAKNVNINGLQSFLLY